MSHLSGPILAAHWFRRDLRLEDNTALHHALRSGYPVLPVFIFDRDILDLLPRRDARVSFIHQRLAQLQAQLAALGSSLVVRYGRPADVWQDLADTYALHAVYTNHDYEPYARQRDAAIGAQLQARGIGFHTFRDQVLLEKDEVLTAGGTPYTVFTPYARRWRETLTTGRLRPFETDWDAFYRQPATGLPSLGSMGFEDGAFAFPPATPDEATIRAYDQQRNYPARPGTTRLGLHLRFGTLSIRSLATQALALNATYLNELVWREFYQQILWHFPHVVDQPFKPAYAAIPWRNDEGEYQRWCQGRTGYPIVDAGMRELNATGYMHNRVRMITASFLAKHLLIDWRWGEAYFAEKLLDFELASNNGGWQWAAGCGTDAAPYFRIFNPEAQMKKFDPDLRYVRTWVPEYGTPAYPREIVSHPLARERCLEAYRSALKAEPA
ncbi:MAG: deoxyribodipyrimidine photo-lyase [Bacteroidia bacterium]